jgi:acyl transferase domain-containing protein
MNTGRGEVAVVGLGVLAAGGADGPENLWSVLCDTPSSFGEDPARFDSAHFHDPDTRAEDTTYGSRYGYVRPFTPHPRLAEELRAGTASDDPAELWLRHVLMRALDATNVRPDDRCILIVGYPLPGSLRLDETLVARSLAAYSGSEAPADACHMPYESVNCAARGLLPERHEIVVLDSACSSALYAVALGRRALLAGEVDVAVCAGTYAVIPRDCVTFAKARGMSPSGRLRAFDVRADGAVLGDAAGAVVLKSTGHAARDEDRVLAVVAGVGMASDGRGKAIYAPDPRGQRLAVERALASAALSADDVDLVVAHGTGTPVGDQAELTSLTAGYSGHAKLPVVSNKSILGHSCNASGAVSLAHAVLALRHELIPRQFDCAQPHTLDGPLVIPQEDVPWPRSEQRRRIGAVSSFGFGGTDIHLLVSDRPHPGAVPVHGEEPVLLMAWEALLPGRPPRRDTINALRQGFWQVPLSAGEPYPADQEAAMAGGVPPAAVERVDRVQLMALECVQQMAQTQGTLWESCRATTGVLVGHCGPTTAGVLYTLRCHAREVRARHAGVLPKNSLDAHAAAVRRRIPPVSLDAVAGVMPGGAAARVSKAHDLRGFTLAIDQGYDSTLGAITVARRALAAGELDMALVVGLHGNLLPEFTGMMAPAGAGYEIAEGAFVLVLARGSAAHSLPVPPLARLRSGADEPVPSMTVRCGPFAGRSLLGADGAVALVRALAHPAECVAVRSYAGGTALLVDKAPAGLIRR